MAQRRLQGAAKKTKVDGLQSEGLVMEGCQIKYIKNNFTSYVHLHHFYLSFTF